jgi:26S proteasome regulatory subunit N10
LSFCLFDSYILFVLIQFLFFFTKHSPEVLVTHTKDLGHIIHGVHAAAGKIGGCIDVQTAIAVAQLALKHRENKNLRQRIIVFIASPLDGPGADEQSMVKLAKKLKKNNVAVDIVSYGDGIQEVDADGKTILKSFVDNVTSSDNSFVFFPFCFENSFIYDGFL